MDTKDRIKALRESLKISQSELARRLGINAATVNRWEMGLTEPSNMAIQKIEQLEKKHGHKNS